MKLPIQLNARTHVVLMTSLVIKKQVSRQTKPRKLSYSADDLDKSGIDDTKVEQILAKKPGITFNIQELVCSVLKDDSFINKLVPKICESVCQKLEEKYVNLVNDVVKPLQESVIKQAELIKQQSTTIDKHVVHRGGSRISS